jgi:hypothetical protein
MEYLLSAETASQQQEMIADQLGWIDFSKRMEGFIKAVGFTGDPRTGGPVR